MVVGTFTERGVVAVETTWHDGPEVKDAGGLMADERFADVVREVLDGTDQKCEYYDTHCAAMIGAFESEDFMGNAKMIWNDFYVCSDNGKVAAYCGDCILEVAPI